MNLRTYRRRHTTRRSGYQTCEETTGGECIILYADRHILKSSSEKFVFKREKLELVELFEKGISIIAFGGYIYSSKLSEVNIEISYEYEGQKYLTTSKSPKNIDESSWANVGLHSEHVLNKDTYIYNIQVIMEVSSIKDACLDFISFDLDVIKKEEFIDNTLAKSFYQKTNMHIPYLYYLDTEQPINNWIISNQIFTRGQRVVLKSCNRCARFLPINIDDELKTLSFSLHCKKNAPCTHSTFRSYKIENYNDLSPIDLVGLNLENEKVISYYGHQLECKACKKFFVNAPLNPQRTPQQFKEDGLRRRALEVLVNNLLQKNLVHFEFEKRTKKEFSNYIWKKFDKRCFKCGPNSAPIKLNEMALDHTMPLAYLYRLDETATCLCASHNSQKSDTFPVDYYTEDELIRLSKITNLSIDYLKKKEVNHEVVNLLIENIVWYFDDFLMDGNYQKVRDGILTADKINDSLKRVLGRKYNLVQEYYKVTKKYPTSVTIK